MHGPSDRTIVGQSCHRDTRGRRPLQVNGLDVPGLGLNIARFNVGGCSWNTITNGTERISMVASPNIPK